MEVCMTMERDVFSRGPSIKPLLTVVLISSSAGIAQVQKDAALRIVLPTVVEATLYARFPMAVIYDIEFRQGGRKFEMDVYENGTIHNWEKAIGRRDLFPSVLATGGRIFADSGKKK
jgi:hypothetical protein